MKSRSKRRRRAREGHDPILLIRACYPDIRQVAPIPRQSGYFVTDDGRVVSMARGDPRIRAHGRTKDGLVVVRTASKAYSAARLVLAVFGPGPRSRKYLAHHINGIVHDNRIENLCWITDSKFKKDIAHPAQRARASKVSRRVAVVRIRHRYPDAGELRAVDGFSTYFVDDGGRIYSVWGMEARRLVARRDHSQVALRGPDGAVAARTWGTVVATAFVGPRPSTGHYVVHLDGDDSNFRASNLAWVKRGPVPKYTVRFGPDEVRAIRFLKEKGESSFRIGTVFGCSDAMVDDISSGRSYASVRSTPGDPLQGLPRRLVSKIHRETRFGAKLAPAAYMAHQMARVREAFPKAGALRPIVGYLDYFIAKDGDVYSTQRGRVRRLAVTKGCVGLVDDGRPQHYRSVRSLVHATWSVDSQWS